MADCDLCGVGLPTLNPVRVMKPRFAQSFPKGMWAGLCDTCLSSSNEVHENFSITGGFKGKCDLCGAKTLVYPLDVEIPSFGKGTESEEKHLCKSCLNGSHERYVKKQEEPDTGHH